MTCSESRLTSRTPICRWNWMIVSDERGYSLKAWHAHVGGLLTDCPEEMYDRLTAAELLDVLDVLTYEISQVARARPPVQ